MSARYDSIDIHVAAKAVTWPAVIPPMSEADAINASRRLFRWACGERFTGKVVVTSGNRRAFRFERGQTKRLATIHVNPFQGWRDFAHDASHWFDILVNGESKHGMHHARFEAKLIREIVRRGWLAPVDRETPHRVALQELIVVDPRLVKLRRIEARIAAWQTKAKRAETALKKLAVKQRYYTKALATPAKPRATRAPVESVKAKAARLGIEIERIEGGYNVWPPESLPDDDTDPFGGDHFANEGWSDVRKMVNTYASLLETP